MDNVELATTRGALGLSQKQAAAVLGVDMKSYQRWEADPSLPYARAVPPTVARLMAAYATGYRPKDWPL